MREPLILIFPVGEAIVKSVLDSFRGVYEVCWVSMTSLVEKSMQFTLAKSSPTVKQYIHSSRNLMYFGIGCSPTETVYADSYHFVDFKMDPIKKQSRGVLSDYIAPQPMVGYQPMKFEFPDEDISRCSNRKIERSLYPGYRKSVHTSTGATPFSLVYGMEAVLPVEVQIPSLRVLMDVKLQEAEWVRTRYEELSLIEEKRLAAPVMGSYISKG
ncbi:hypothetical protein KIW84_060265 [Lathyrus oleraceus]|uniref:Uncharacterized protein n=1 Tax=Pisum sativum TaxID=3888 RepID=A0A9D4W2H1_PEA|nr:hypothetical protein KIW84_060265 [Pisum sativum]